MYHPRQLNIMTLIQRGEGTGPTKPRQPGDRNAMMRLVATRVPNPADSVLEDERMAVRFSAHPHSVGIFVTGAQFGTHTSATLSSN